MHNTRNTLSRIGPEDTQMLDSIDNMLGDIVPEGIENRGEVIEGLRGTLLERAKDGVAPTHNGSINDRTDKAFADMDAQNIGSDTNSTTVTKAGNTETTTTVRGQNAITNDVLDNVGEQMGWERQEVIDFAKDYRGNMKDPDFRNGNIKASFDGAVDNAFASNNVPVMKSHTLMAGKLNGMIDGTEENQDQNAQSEMVEPNVDASKTYEVDTLGM